jgi:hypothetical protein
MLIPPQLVVSVVFVVALGWALTRRTGTRIEVSISVSTMWALDLRCRAIGYLLSEAPGLRRVEIDLGDLFIADRSTVSLLTCTQRRLEDANVTLSIVAAPAVSRLLLASGLPVSTRGALDELTSRTDSPN